MAIALHAVDGLINRLLQQQSARPASMQPPSSTPSAKADHISISSASQQLNAAQPGMEPVTEKGLESHLLNLYRSNDTYGG